MTPKVKTPIRPPPPSADGVLYVSARQLARRYGVNRTTIWRWAKSGRLPAPVRIASTSVRWDLRAVEAFDAARDSA